MKKFLKKVGDAVGKPIRAAVKAADKVAQKAAKLDPTRAMVNKLAGKKLAGKLDMARTLVSRGPGIMRTAQASNIGKKIGRMQGKVEEKREEAKKRIPNAFRNSFGLESTTFKRGGSVTKPGLYANIHAKKKRIAAGSGEKMRKVGAKGAPSKQDFIDSAKTAKPVKRAAGSSPKGETLDQELEAFGKRTRSGQLGPGQKKSDLPLVDQYEVDRKMGRFSGSFKEYMDSKEGKKFKHGGAAMKHSDKTGRAMKKLTADAKGRAMPKAFTRR